MRIAPPISERIVLRQAHPRAPSERIRAADGHQLKAKQLTADTDDIERDARTAEPSGPPAEN
jgi:hypothetical protein